MKKAIKIALSAALAAVFCFSLASCNKGTCDGCRKENVDRTKVTIKDKDLYYCDDCYKAYEKLNNAAGAIGDLFKD